MTHDLTIDAAGCPAPPGAGKTRTLSPWAADNADPWPNWPTKCGRRACQSDHVEHVAGELRTARCLRCGNVWRKRRFAYEERGGAT